MSIASRNHLIDSTAGTTPAATTLNNIVSSTENDVFVVTWEMTSAVPGDLDLLEVRPVSDSGLVMPTVLSPDVLQAKAVVGAKVVAMHRFNTSGINRVEVRVRNAAGAARLLDVYITHYDS